MKRLFLLVVCAISFSVSGQKLGGGVYAGLITSQIEGDGLSGFSYWSGQLGVYTKIQLGQYSDLKLELGFLQKGARQVPDSTNGFIQYKLSGSYIEIPILYRFFWQDLSFEIGPAIDINVSQKEESNYVEVQPYADFNKVHLAGIFGISYHMSESWYVNFRTNVSITPARGTLNAPGTGPGWLRGGERFIVLSTALVYEFNQ